MFFQISSIIYKSFTNSAKLLESLSTDILKFIYGYKFGVPSYLLLGIPHCKKKSVQCTPNMVCYVCPVWNTLYGVKLRQIFGVCFTPNWVCFHTTSVCFPTNFSVFSHSLWRIFTLSQCAFPLTSVCFPTPSSVFSH